MKLLTNLCKDVVERRAAYVTRHVERLSIVARNIHLLHIFGQTRLAHQRVSRASVDSILPFDLAAGGRPTKLRTRRKTDPFHRAYFFDVLRADFRSSRNNIYRGERETDWWFQCKQRLVRDFHFVNYSNVRAFWGLLRHGCLIAMLDGLDPKEDADARITCARSKTQGYPPIYHTLHQQADALYLLGRVELERDPKFHRMAWYMLNLATELGQLDAALLLHRLERVNSSLPAGTKARSMIQRVAVNSADWRAIMAYVEMEILDRPEGKHNLQSTAQVFEILRGWYLSKTLPLDRMTAGSDLDPLSHPDALEEYVPLCRYLWQVAKIGGDRLLPYLESQGYINDRHRQEIAAAIYDDAVKYHNPKAMYEVTRLPPHLGYEESRAGTKPRMSMLQNASSTIPEARYILGKELCQMNSIIPTQKSRERASQQPVETQYPQLSPGQIKGVQHIIDAANGFHGKSTATEVYLYLLAAGLYHDNGMINEGRAVIETAIRNVQETLVTTEEDNSSWIKLFDGLLQRWDSYGARGLYVGVRPEDVIPILDRMILNETNEG